jgi:hypothetical protein
LLSWLLSIREDVVSMSSRDDGGGHLDGVGVTAALGAGVGAVVAFAAVLALLLVTGSDRVTALSAAAFAALWGGCGLGAMLGASHGFARRMR